MSELAGYAVHQVRGRVPYRTGSAVVRIHGEGRVEGVTVADVDDRWQPVAGTGRELSCDAVCLGHGFVPRLELAIAAGCELTDQRFVAVDAHQRTTVTGVLAAGELTQIGGVDLARHPQAERRGNRLADSLGQIEDICDRVAILDGAQDQEPLDADGALQTQKKALELTRGFGALYWPWIQVPDPTAPADTPALITIAPSGHIAGVLARSAAVLATALAGGKHLTRAELARVVVAEPEREPEPVAQRTGEST